MNFFERLSAAGAAAVASFGTPESDWTAQLAAGFTPEPSAAFGPSSTVSNSGSWMLEAIGTKTEAGPVVSNYTAITLPAVYACVSLLADSLAQLPLNLHRLTSDGGSEIATDHILQQLVHSAPNKDMTAFTFRQTEMHHTLLWGNGYAEIERDGAGRARSLWPLYPDRTHPTKPPGGDLKYQTQVNGKPVTLRSENVLHFPALGFDGFVGYSPVTIARNAIGMGLAMEKFGSKFFANDSKSGGFLMHPGKLGDQASTNIVDSFQKQGGADNAFKVKVLEEGMKFISTTIPPDDAQFLSSREFQVAEIARMFRVPLILLQSMEKATSWGSGIEQQMIGFVVFTLQPWIKSWEQELNKKLLSEEEQRAGYYFHFNINALMRGDMAARAEFYKALHGVSAIKPNEIRRREDMNPYADGEDFYYPLNMGVVGEELPDDDSNPVPAIPPETEEEEDA